MQSTERLCWAKKKKKAGGRNPEMQPINSQGDDTVPQSDSLRLDTSHCLL